MHVSGDPLLVVDGLSKRFVAHRGLAGKGRGEIRAVDDVSFTVGRQETLGLIGESGSGKSTTGLCVLRLLEPSSGSVWVDGIEITSASRRGLRESRRHMHIIFQSPYASLNPRLSIGASIAEPLEAHRVGTRKTRQARVRDLLEHVGLDPAAGRRFPQEFSGGERQRIGIARALALEPKLVVCDEPVSALDVSIQAQILNLLRDLQDEFGLSYLFISHDIAVIKAMSDHVAVMKDGRITESGTAQDVCERPSHPYTRELLEAAELRVET